MVELKPPELLAKSGGRSFSFCLYQCCISGFLVSHLSVVQRDSLTEQLVEQSLVSAPACLFCEGYDREEPHLYREGVFGKKLENHNRFCDWMA